MGIASTAGKALSNIKNHHLQRLFIELSNLNYSIEHLHGDKMHMTDALSHAPLKNYEFIDEDEKSENDDPTNIFIMRNLTEEVNNMDEIENLDLEMLQKYIDKDED